jgi:Zn-dependent protease with chaperone function
MYCWTDLIPLLIDLKITTIDKELIRTSEFEADNFAVRYTGDLVTAENVLKKITNGNIDVPSHFFEYGDKKIPALTVEERIENIKKAF